MRMTTEEYNALMLKRKPEVKRAKYGNIKTEVDGIIFDSVKEAARYGELKLLVKAEEICDLEVQPRYELKVNGIRLGAYVGDFRYFRYIEPLVSVRQGYDRVEVVEDVKGVKTPVYRLKKKLMLALHNIDIEEI